MTERPQAAAERALPPGTALGNYRVDAVLGAGGFGLTYRAVEPITERVVAIKEFLPKGIAQRQGHAVTVAGERAQKQFAWGLSRFRDEARTLIALRHPNIVQVLQYFEANGTGYLVMQYEEGAVLGQRLAEGVPLPPAEIARMVPPLLDGLEALHAQGFLHRDIKPDNIFLRKNGEPLLIDFGAARQAIGRRGKALTAIVSRGFAPYEQYQDTARQGPWTDIYALGATLYACMTGMKPVEAPARLMALTKGAGDPLLRPPAAGHDPNLVRLVESALAVFDSERPQSVAACRAILRGEIMPREDAATVWPYPDDLASLAAEESAALRAAAYRQGRRLFRIGVALTLGGLAALVAAFVVELWT